jgi:hypothetical protein
MCGLIDGRRLPDATIPPTARAEGRRQHVDDARAGASRWPTAGAPTAVSGETPIGSLAW